MMNYKWSLPVLATTIFFTQKKYCRNKLNRLNVFVFIAAKYKFTT